MNDDLTIAVVDAIPAESVEALRLAVARAEEAAKEARVQKLVAMRALVKRLSGERDELIKAKRPIETMMLDSLRLYRGEECFEDATKAQPVNSDSTSRPPRQHILRALTDKWEARISEMLSANPWSLEPDCDPEELRNNQELAAQLQQKCDAMEKTIRNQLEWCKFDRAIRNMAKDGAQIGTGLITGPRAAVRTKRKYAAQEPASDWQAQGFVPPSPPQSRMVTEETLVPEFDEADPFMFYPDMTERAEKSEKAFYVRLMGKVEIQNLKPGFDEFQINALLRTEPDLGELRTNLSLRMQYLKTADIYKDKYAVWRYTGVLGRKDLEILDLCGCESPNDDEGNPEPVEMAMADIWFCQDFILRAKLAPVPDDYRIPYYVFAPFPLEGSMFGMSLPMMGADSNKVANAAWLMALHNQSVSSGQLIVLDQGKLTPADRQWSIRGPKVFYTKDGGVPSDVINAFTVPNESEGALRIMDRAIGLMHEELNAKQWASEEGAAEHETASGLAMVLNVNSILQGRVAATGDDDVIEPAIYRAIWWNNDNSDDESIKGNYIVRPLVQSERLVKDVRQQQTMAFTQMVSDPRFEGMVDNRKLLEMNVAQLDGPYTDTLVPESEYRENMANKPPDPAVLQQQYLALRAETEKAKQQTELVRAQTEQVKQQREMLELQLAAQPSDNPENPDLALRIRQLELDEKETDNALEIARMREEGVRLIAAARMAETRQKAQEQAMQKAQEQKNKLMLEGMKLEGNAQEMAFKKQFGSGI